MKLNTKENIISQYGTFLCMMVIVLMPIWLSFMMIFFHRNGYAYDYNYVFSLVIFITLIPMPFIFGEKFIFHFVKPKNSNKTLWFALLFLALFLVWATISVFFAVNKSLALFDFSGRGEGLLMYFAYACILLGAMGIKSEKLRDILLKSTLGVGLYFCLFTVLDHYAFRWGETFVSWPFTAPWSNPNHSGYFLTIIAGISSITYLFHPEKFTRIYAIVVFFLISVVTCLNDAFGSQLSIFILMIFVLIVTLVRDKKLWHKLLILFGIYICTVLIGHLLEKYTLGHKETILGNFVHFFQDIFKIASDAESEEAQLAGTNRWGLWMECFRNMRDKPLFGIGINCQKVVNPTLEASRPHNELLQFASTMGIPAGLFYLTALILLLITAFKQLRHISPITISFITAAVGYFINSLFGVSLPYTFCFYMIFLGLSISGLKLKKDTTSIELTDNLIKKDADLQKYIQEHDETDAKMIETTKNTQIDSEL